jgi:hypothetical protein
MVASYQKSPARNVTGAFPLQDRFDLPLFIPIPRKASDKRDAIGL